MEHTKWPEFETTIFDVNTEILMPPIIQMWGKYKFKGNIVTQLLRDPSWNIVYIHQEIDKKKWSKVVVEHKIQIPNTHNKIVSYQGTWFEAKDFHSVLRTFIQMWFSQYNEPYGKFRFAYESWENHEIWEVRFNFDTYEIKWEISPLVLKIVAKTGEDINRVASLLWLDESELHWIEPIDIYHKLDSKNNI